MNKDLNSIRELSECLWKLHIITYNTMNESANEVYYRIRLRTIYWVPLDAHI